MDIERELVRRQASRIIKAEIKPKMLKIYQPHLYDWMGFVITKDSRLSTHHLVKWEFLPPTVEAYTDINNLALLTVDSHNFLHIIENTWPDIYRQYNDLFFQINHSQKPPTNKMLEKAFQLKESILFTAPSISNPSKKHFDKNRKTLEQDRLNCLQYVKLLTK